MSLSLLVHGGVVSAVYVLRPNAVDATRQFDHERALEMEIDSEPEREAASRPAPEVEIPKPLPPPAPPASLAENQTPDGAIATYLPAALNQPMKAAPPPAPVVELEAKTVPQSVPVQSASLPAIKLEGGIPANYLVNPKPAYPPESRRHREEGLVVLAVPVSRDGFPGRIQIVQSSKFPLLDSAAVAAVSQWRFIPARIGTLAVASQIEVPIRFRLTGP